METKKCRICDEDKPLTEEYFHKREKGSNDGFRSECKECIKKRNRQYYIDNLEKRTEYQKQYYEQNKELCNQQSRQYRADHREELREKDRQYYAEHRDEILKQANQYHKEHRETILQRFKKWREEHAEEHRQNARDYYWNNREKCLQQKKTYQLENPEVRKRYYEEHKEQLKIWRKNWKQKNPDKIRTYTHRKRAKRKLLPATLTTKQWQIIKDYFNNKCCYCGKELPLEQEHFIPAAKSGGFTHNNIICACRSCNLSKTDHLFWDWYPKQKFYSRKREAAILKFLGYDKQGTQQPALMI